ncbi:hypothetical protein [uncultured Tessaracoccus sp.]|uniref:hypothetical protein n=1 Tax=uncultured Tessaracoccus sp. TaxID=905023 RepID=UPI00261C3C09|nr:hypothetical protein [uncultured Tessaracoccus sp.]
MSYTESPLSATVERVLSNQESELPTELPEPASVRVERHAGAVAVTSDGRTVTVELMSPLKLTAPELAEALTQAANEALQQAHEQFMSELAAADGGSSLESMAALGAELREAYDAEWKALDERIDKVAAL